MLAFFDGGSLILCRPVRAPGPYLWTSTGSPLATVDATLQLGEQPAFSGCVNAMAQLLGFSPGHT
jgi:hypothetical protein